MSAAKQAIDAIKKLLNFSIEEPAPTPTPAPAPAAEQEYACADGSKVMIDKMEVGGKVTKDGEAVPDGDLTLENGKVLTVTAGLISGITDTKPAEEPLETPEQMRAALQKFEEGATAPDMQKMAVILKALFERSFGWELREAQEKALRDQAIAAYQTGFSKQQDALKQLVELVETIADQPTAEPLEKPANWDEMTPLQRFRAAKQMFKDQN